MLSPIPEIMLKIAITLPIASSGGEETQVIPLHLRVCKCGCGKYLDPSRRNQRFLNPAHRIEFNNKRRRKNSETFESN